jgi:hypothetical protein
MGSPDAEGTRRRIIAPESSVRASQVTIPESAQTKRLRSDSLQVLANTPPKRMKSTSSRSVEDVLTDISDHEANTWAPSSGRDSSPEGDASFGPRSSPEPASGSDWDVDFNQLDGVDSEGDGDLAQPNTSSFERPTPDIEREIGRQGLDKTVRQDVEEIGRRAVEKIGRQGVEEVAQAGGRNFMGTTAGSPTRGRSTLDVESRASAPAALASDVDLGVRRATSPKGDDELARAFADSLNDAEADDLAEAIERSRADLAISTVGKTGEASTSAALGNGAAEDGSPDTTESPDIPDTRNWTDKQWNQLLRSGNLVCAHFPIHLERYQSGAREIDEQVELKKSGWRLRCSLCGDWKVGGAPWRLSVFRTHHRACKTAASAAAAPGPGSTEKKTLRPATLESLGWSKIKSTTHRSLTAETSSSAAKGGGAPGKGKGRAADGVETSKGVSGSSATSTSTTEPSGRARGEAPLQTLESNPSGGVRGKAPLTSSFSSLWQSRGVAKHFTLWLYQRRHLLGTGYKPIKTSSYRIYHDLNTTGISSKRIARQGSLGRRMFKQRRAYRSYAKSRLS